MSPVKSDVALQLAERIRSRAGTGTVKPPDSVYEWAHRYRFLDKHEFTLDRFRPLHALYEDDWQRIVVMKPAQRGVSEWAINLACFALECGARKWVPDGSKSGINVAIIFPARGDLIDFSKERLSSLKEETTHLAAMFAGEEFDSLGFKQVGDSFLYLRGGYSEAGLRSFPCDVLILDEYDQLDTSAIALARRRMNASMIRREVRISTPTIPGKGISAAYAASDQRVYETKCPYCGTWNTYDFFSDVWCDGVSWDEWQKWSQAHVETTVVELRCPACKTVQTEADRCSAGRWVSNAPEVTRVHGYHIPWWPFPRPMVELDALASSAVSGDPTEQEEFFRSDLGLPHGAGGGVIDEEMLAQLSAMLPEGLPDGPWRDTVLGADIGARIHYCIDSIGPDNAVYVRKMGSVADWSELDMLMSQYQVRQAVIDAEPEIITAINFCERWIGRAIRCFYPTAATALKGTLYNRKDGTFDVQANRTMLLDTMYAAIATASERWPKEITSDPEVIQHMSNAVRVKVTDEDTGQQRYSWVRTGADHLMHACLIAGTEVQTANGVLTIEDIRPGMLVQTRAGLRRVLAAGCTDADAEVTRYTFSNGQALTATPNHPVYTSTRGFIPLHALTYEDTLGARPMRAESGTASTPNASSALSSHIPSRATGARNRLLVRIARMASASIVLLLAVVLLGAPVVWMTSMSFVRCVGRRGNGIDTPKQGSVRVAVPEGTALRLVAKERVGRQPVFNLTVDGEEEYFANGFLVHNCAYRILARRLLPAAQSNGHAVVGNRPLVAEYQRIAQHDLGALGRSIPSWIPPAIR